MTAVDTREGDGGRSFTSPETSFTILKTSRGRVEGYECDACGGRAASLFDIDHDQGCPQADVR